MLAGYTISADNFRFLGLRFCEAKDALGNSVFVISQTFYGVAWPSIFCTLQLAGITARLDKNQKGHVVIVCQPVGSLEDLSVQITNALSSALSRTTGQTRFHADKGWILPADAQADAQADAEADAQADDSLIGSVPTQAKAKRAAKFKGLRGSGLIALTLAVATCVTLSFLDQNDFKPSNTGLERAVTTEGNSTTGNSIHVPETQDLGEAHNMLDASTINDLVNSKAQNVRTIVQTKFSLKRLLGNSGWPISFAETISLGGVTHLVIETKSTGQMFAIDFEKINGFYALATIRELK